jgi:hypothetical protein
MSIGDAGPVCEVDAEHEQCRGWRNVVLEGAAKVSRGGADYGFCPGCGVVVVEVVEVVWIVKYSYSAQMSVGPLTHWPVKFLSLQCVMALLPLPAILPLDLPLPRLVDREPEPP